LPKVKPGKKLTIWVPATIAQYAKEHPEFDYKRICRTALEIAINNPKNNTQKAKIKTKTTNSAKTNTKTATIIEPKLELTDEIIQKIAKEIGNQITKETTQKPEPKLELTDEIVQKIAKEIGNQITKETTQKPEPKLELTDEIVQKIAKEVSSEITQETAPKINQKTTEKIIDIATMEIKTISAKTLELIANAMGRRARNPRPNPNPRPRTTKINNTELIEELSSKVLKILSKNIEKQIKIQNNALMPIQSDIPLVATKLISKVPPVSPRTTPNGSKTPTTIKLCVVCEDYADTVCSACNVELCWSCWTGDIEEDGEAITLCPRCIDKYRRLQL
jgi:hypothetical protein